MPETTAQPLTFFSEAQAALVEALADVLIPPRGNTPGAGQAGGVVFIDREVRRSPELRRAFLEGLHKIDLAAHAKGGKPFASLPEKAKVSVLQSIESAEPIFFETLIQMVYGSYYTNPEVLKKLGLPHEPPQPKGYKLEQGQTLVLIEKVKARKKLYRDA
ncbi:MAG: gluconate 2-dehydrogenase subunit 3 family protein [SAR202 cluster bacterium]|nr:gluconate 2-dehydrogenase subunit 3 family protein [SAR202 cluster bacterium]